MLEYIQRHWWVFAVRGVLAIIVGVLAFVRPDITLVALIALFGAYALVDGIFSVVTSFLIYGSRYFWWLLLEGILGIAVGVMTFVNPHAMVASLLLLLGIWLIFSGIFRLVVAIELRKLLDNEWFYMLGSLCAIAAGVLTLYRPNQSALAWLWVIGFYAILYGILMLTLGFKLRKWGSEALPGNPVTHG